MGLPLRWYTSSQRKIWLILVVTTLKEDGDIFKYITQQITEVTTIPKADLRFCKPTGLQQVLHTS